MINETHRSFLLDERGIRPETAEAFGLYSEGDDCLVIPHRTGEKRRYGKPEDRKFMFTKGQMPYLYCPPEKYTVPQPVAFVVEGETDSMRLWQALEDGLAHANVYGIPGIHTWKPHWAKELEDYERVFVILDNDEDYKVRAEVDKLWERLQVDIGPKATRVRLPDGVKDVCEFFRNFDLEFLREIATDSLNGKYHYKALDLSIEPPPFEWLIEGLICQGDTVLWMGPPGVGKSISALSLAVAMASGKDSWLDMPLLKSGGKVMVVDRENPRDVVYNRLHGFGATPEVLENFRYILHQDVRLDDRARASKLMDEAKAFKPDLIILDSLVRFHRMDENSATQMAQVFDEGIKPIAHETGATIIVLHHSIKGDTNDSFQKGRGSGEIAAAPDTAIEVKVTTDKGGRCLKHFKGRRSKNNETVNFEIQEDDAGRMNVRRVAASF